MNCLGPVFFLLGTIALGVPQPSESQLKLTKEVLADGVYLLRASTELDRWTATNVVVIVNEHDVTVFDSFTRPPTARMAIAEIRALTDKPVRTLINSHWHMDHWSGNDEFRKAFPGIQIIATAETRQYMTRMGSSFLIDGTRAGLGRSREALDAAIKTGRLADGTVLTDDVRKEREKDIDETARFVEEISGVPRVLPDTAFHDELTFWRGAREFRLFSMTGDATGSAVLYLPAEKILVTGDVFVSPPDGQGPPPWTTNSYAIRPWLASLRRLEAFDTSVIVPGQGPAMRDDAYLRLTIELFAGIIGQVQSALERGIFKTDDVLAAVNVDAIGRRYPLGRTGPNTPFERMVAALTRKTLQESLDGVVR
jgi:glyoxylase-like metal-dependent hydrolase (beta-lactamase superfamily II)